MLTSEPEFLQFLLVRNRAIRDAVDHRSHDWASTGFINAKHERPVCFWSRFGRVVGV